MERSNAPRLWAGRPCAVCAFCVCRAGCSKEAFWAGKSLNWMQCKHPQAKTEAAYLRASQTTSEFEVRFEDIYVDFTG